MPFVRVEGKKKSEQVAEQLLRAIESGVYRLGDRLPPERELAAQTGVSRTAVREALSALQLAGVIERKTGLGSFVRKAVVEALPSSPLSAAAQTGELGLEGLAPTHIWEAHQLLAGQIAELAVERLTVRSLRKLKMILREMRTLAKSREYDDYAAACEAFHLTVAEASGNPILMRTMALLFEIAKGEWGEQIRRGYYAPDGNIDPCFELHRKLLKAMEDGDKLRVRKLLSTLFREIKEHLLSK